MNEDEVELEVHFGGNFVVDPEFYYEKGDLMDICNLDVENCPSLSWKGVLKSFVLIMLLTCVI